MVEQGSWLRSCLSTFRNVLVKSECTVLYWRHQSYFAMDWIVTLQCWNFSSSNFLSHWLAHFLPISVSPWNFNPVNARPVLQNGNLNQTECELKVGHPGICRCSFALFHILYYFHCIYYFCTVIVFAMPLRVLRFAEYVAADCTDTVAVDLQMDQSSWRERES